MKKRLQYILKFAKPHRWQFGALFTCIILTIFIGSVFHYLFGRMVDEVFYGKNMSRFIEIVVLYAVVYAVNQSLHFGLNMSWAHLMTKFLFDIRKAVFDTILHAKGHSLAGLYSGDMMSRMGTDVDEFMNFIHWNVFYFIGGTLNLLISIGFIAVISPPIAVLTVILTPLTVYGSLYFAKIVKPYYEALKANEGLLSSWLFEMVKGLKEIQLLGASKYVIRTFVQRSIEVTRLSVSTRKVTVVSERVNAGISTLGLLCMYALAAILIVKNQLTLGGFVACVSYFGTCVSAFKILNSKASAITGNMVSIDRVISILEWPREGQQIDDMKPPAHPITQISLGHIRLEDIHFAYKESLPVLSGLTLDIPPGDVVALVGQSGAGKSTLAALLQRFYEPCSGRITVDGHNISDMDLKAYRQQVGVVQQETILFEGTLRYNLTLNQEASDDALWSALEKAHLSDFVKSLPLGLDTRIGSEMFDSEGSPCLGLSGGQKQRLAIARLFLRNPKILVFDEATSSLDSEAEAVIQESWHQLCEGRTLIVIAHRLSTILSAKHVAVLEGGKLAGVGSHDELLRQCEAYRVLFEEQHGHQEGGQSYEVV